MGICKVTGDSQYKCNLTPSVFATRQSTQRKQMEGQKGLLVDTRRTGGRRHIVGRVQTRIRKLKTFSLFKSFLFFYFGSIPKPQHSMDFLAHSGFIKSMKHTGDMLHTKGSPHYVLSLLMLPIRRSVQHVTLEMQTWAN